MATHGLNELLTMAGFTQPDQTEAVKSAQQAYGLPVDGRPTMLLIESLREHVVPKAAQQTARVQKPMAVIPTRQLQGLPAAQKDPPAPGSVGALLQDENIRTMLKLGLIAAVGVGFMSWRNSRKKKARLADSYTDVTTPADLEGDAPEEAVVGEPSNVAEEVFSDAEYEATNNYEG